MKQKFKKLSLWSFILALALFVWSYFLFHYATPEGGFSLVYRAEPAKPLVTELWSILGVLFLFSSILSGIIGRIFFPGQK